MLICKIKKPKKPKGRFSKNTRIKFFNKVFVSLFFNYFCKLHSACFQWCSFLFLSHQQALHPSKQLFIVMRCIWTKRAKVLLIHLLSKLVLWCLTKDDFMSNHSQFKGRLFGVIHPLGLAVVQFAFWCQMLEIASQRSERIQIRLLLLIEFLGMTKITDDHPSRGVDEKVVQFYVQMCNIIFKQKAQALANVRNELHFLSNGEGSVFLNEELLKTKERRHQKELCHSSCSIGMHCKISKSLLESIEEWIGWSVFKFTQNRNDVFVGRNGFQHIVFVVEIFWNIYCVNSHVYHQFQCNVSNAFH